MTPEASQRLVSDLKTLATDTQDVIKETAEQSGAKLREKARMGLGQAQANVAAAQAAVTARARGAARATADYVHKHPWGTMGVAALLAFAIGYIARRR